MRLGVSRFFPSNNQMETSNAAASSSSIPTPLSIPEVRQITDLFDKALTLPEGQLKTNICDALREVLVDYIARAAVKVFFDDNVKYVATEVLAEKKSA